MKLKLDILNEREKWRKDFLFTSRSINFTVLNLTDSRSLTFKLFVSPNGLVILIVWRQNSRHYKLKNVALVKSVTAASQSGFGTRS